MAQGFGKSKIHPKKLALWVACASIVMMFAAMTSAYIVRQSGGNWLEFRMPDVFFYNTVVILLSSMTLHGAWIAFKKMKTKLYQGLLFASFILGLGFILLQYEGWMQLVDTGIELTTNPSSSCISILVSKFGSLKGFGLMVNSFTLLYSGSSNGILICTGPELITEAFKALWI